MTGLTSYTTPAHIALATLEANAFQTRAILESMKLDSKSELKHLKVDGGMTNGDMVMKVLADIGGFTSPFDDMSEAVLSLVVKLDHKVREIRYHRSPEATFALAEVDELLVL